MRIITTIMALPMGLGLLLAGHSGTPAFAQDHVKQRLDTSPRHHEWVNVSQSNRSIRCFVVYPEAKEKAPAVIVIHENKGLSDWVRSVADQLAEQGFVAIAPDLLSGMGPKGGNTDEFESVDAATRAIYTLRAEQVATDLTAVANYAGTIPACNGKLAVAGFCWGGGQAFLFATRQPNLKAAFVFYGTAPYTKADLAHIACPIYGFYGEDDARINATVPALQTDMKEAGKTFDPVIYDGAGHGFMRSGEEPPAETANSKARTAAWTRWLGCLKKL